MASITTPRLLSPPLTSSTLPECTTCLEEISNGGVTTRCNHVFHITCLEQWLDEPKNTCPNCRRENPLPQYKAYKFVVRNTRNIKLITRLVTCSLGIAAIYRGKNKMEQTLIVAGKTQLIPYSLLFCINNIPEAKRRENLLHEFTTDAPGIIAQAIIGSFLFGSIIDKPDKLCIPGCMAETLFFNLLENDQVVRACFKLPSPNSKTPPIKKIIINSLCNGLGTAISILIYRGGETIVSKASKIFSLIMQRR